MKTFADYLPTMTERERDIVEEFWSYPCDCEMKKAVALMRSTPPAKEPVSVDGVVEIYHDVIVVINHVGINPGDRVRVVKIEETK